MTIADPTFPKRLPHPPRLRKYSPAEYHQMAADGFFQNQRVELIDGDVIEMSPQNEPHARTLSRISRLLTLALPAGFELRCQMPLALGKSEPEPDIAIVSLPLPTASAPTTAALVIEVADTSLAIDRKKSHLYASAQIPEYWLINLLSRTLERSTASTPDPAAPFSAKYATLTHHSPGDSLTPLALPIPPLALAAIFSAIQ